MLSPASNAESKRNRGDAAVSSNILSSSLPSITDNSQSYADTDADGRRATRKKRTRENSRKARKSDAKAGVSAVGNGERIGASSPLSASTSNASLRTRTRSRDRDQDQERGVETSRTRSRRHRSRDRTTPTLAPHQESSIPTRDRLTLFRRAFSALELSSGRDRPSKTGIRKNHTVAWMDGRQDDYQHSSVSGASHDPDSSRRFRNDMLARRRTAFGGSRRPRKTGIPGKNGEEPETNVFNFVDIILNMPKDPSWQQVAMKLLKVLALLTIAYFALMALYFAAEFQSTTRLKNFNILVVDLDHSIIGNRFLNFTETDNAAPEQVNWMIQTGYKDVREIAADVERGLYWGAIVVQPNASTILNKALATPLSNYDPTKAFLFIYDGGRDPLVMKPYVVASMYTQFLRFTKVFNPTWVYIVLSFAAESNATLVELTEAPQVLGIPVAFEEMDLHPPTASIITSATSVAYIWIFLVAGGSTYMVAHIVQPMTRYASVRRTIVTLLLPLLLFLCSLSMAYSVLLRVFGVPFESVGQFISLFMGILLLQAAVASLVLFLIFLIPVVFIPIITITFVVMNVIAVFNPVELMPVFYRWVYAMPFLNAVQMARFVLMGSYNRLSYNLPILFAWITIPITLLPFAITRQKRLMMEVLEMERQEWQQAYDRQQRYYFDNSQYRYREDHRFEDDNAEDHELYGRDTVKKQRRWSHESVRPRSTRSRSHPRLGDDTMRDSNTRTRLDTADSDSSHSYNESGDGDGDQHSVNNTTQWVPPPNPLIFGSNASPSAPPESQVFDTHQSSSFIEMPKLSRHPYASELVRPHTPDEVK
ncbi:hypothetical protein BGZ50_006469 [Haplosporangium sp. Z 11]|nr:hypothetical protein BGZ50_006469 [Haplosporangium sp. Z 11]